MSFLVSSLSHTVTDIHQQGSCKEKHQIHRKKISFLALNLLAGLSNNSPVQPIVDIGSPSNCPKIYAANNFNRKIKNLSWPCKL